MNPIKKYLIDEQISVRTLAQACGVTHIYLHSVLSGRRRPSIDLMKKIIDYSNGILTANDIVSYYTSSVLQVHNKGFTLSDH